ncbi:MAG: TonB-dependent receptor plug domain-containing protein [Saprospiraceae bacterium]|nr:TonB-dependent receptor plug domain-containing protein [Saprospiraceae bacterium]
MISFTKLSLLPLIILINLQFGFGQNGVISGKIIEKINGEPVIGAVIRTSEGKFGTTTDFDGNYRLQLPAGDHSIQISFLSFKEQKISVSVLPGSTQTLDVALEEASTEMEEVVVTYTIQKSSSISQLIERRNSALVSDGLSSEQIKKTPDRTASDALKRITGASIQEGKFAIIRGMNDRYNAGYLDGSMLPSTESDRKAFAFDILPAGLIDKIQVIKSGSPELSGDFGGGIIKISTKAIPEKLYQSISVGANYHSLTTFKNFSLTEKSSLENLGFINNDRNIPDLENNNMKISGSFATESEKQRLSTLTKSFDLGIHQRNITASPNTRLSYSFGKPFDFSKTKRAGLIFALVYSDTKKFLESDISNFDGSGQTTELKDKNSSENVNTGGLLNFNYQSPRVQIGFNNLLNVNTDYTLINRQGIGNISDYIEVNSTANLIQVNRLINQNLNYRQILGNNNLVLQAGLSFGDIRRNIPSYKIVSYTKTPDMENYQFSMGEFFNNSSGLFSSMLNEQYYGGNIEISKKWDYKNLVTDIKVGIGDQLRNRDFASRNFVFGGTINNSTMDINKDLADANIGVNGLYLTEKTSDDLASYQGKQDLLFTFFSIDQKYSDIFRINYGARVEKFRTTVENDKIGLQISDINKTSILPSVNFCYLLKEKTNIRASYYASVNRPEFRELAPFAFYAFDKNSEIRGNRDLKIAELQNFDLRMEWFPTGSQVVSLGAFLKTIRNPIEFNIDITQVFSTFTYGNEKAARISGLEFELRKNLGFLGSKNIYKEISILTNASLIHSKLMFNEGSKSLSNRPLQGQSPYILNCGLLYDSENTGWSLTLMANRFGRRIAFVGVDPKFGETRMDIYEAPRTILDFQIGKNYKNFNFKFTVGDILAQNLVFYQDVDQSGKYEVNNDRRFINIKNGFNSNINVSYNF